MSKKYYYFDMDGVLVTYSRKAYEGENPLFMRKNAHYFRYLEPDMKMLSLVTRLHQSCKRWKDGEVYVLTSLPGATAIFNEQFHDKIAWLAEWAPCIDIDHILVSITSKRDAVEYIQNHELTSDDVLIDDYNKNLNEWTSAGGIAVKYCNGINSPDSFQGHKLYHGMATDDLLEKLINIC